MDIIYQDKDILVCVKPAGVLSTDEPGGLPELVRESLGDPNANVRTVHRLDRTVSGLMVLARRSKAASELSRQIREGEFGKEYMAVCHGNLQEDHGEFRDLLLRNKQERKTYIVSESGKDVQEAILEYWVLNCTKDMTRVRIRLHTGRTHQIRAQFSGRGLPLVGDKKYGIPEDDCQIALWSCRLSFKHPYSGKPMEFFLEPPKVYPWSSC
jgi:23S rRNA pseudouridine1911/1915/1917 synthase